MLKTSKQIQRVRLWNRDNPPGTKVTIMVNNSLLDAVTSSTARIHPDSTTGLPCVRIRGYGYIPLDDIEI